MTCIEKIKSIIDAPNQDGYDMERDDWRKLVAIAYYYGRESATREVCDRHNEIIRQQRTRASESRYHKLAGSVIGAEKETFIYSPDYAGDMTSFFGRDRTSL